MKCMHEGHTALWGGDGRVSRMIEVPFDVAKIHNSHIDRGYQGSGIPREEDIGKILGPLVCEDCYQVIFKRIDYLASDVILSISKRGEKGEKKSLLQHHFPVKVPSWLPESTFNIKQTKFYDSDRRQWGRRVTYQYGAQGDRYFQGTKIERSDRPI